MGEALVRGGAGDAGSPTARGVMVLPGGSMEAHAGRSAEVVDPDPLLRLHAEAAARLLGFTVPVAAAAGRRPPTVFLGMSVLAGCPRLSPPAAAGGVRRARRPRVEPAACERLVVGYVAGPDAVLAAHRLHGCCAIVLRLAAAGGGACFAYPSPAHPLERAGITVREADVLLLVLAGLTTPRVAARLGVSPATARTHCRAVLRKLGAADRRELRATLLGGPEPAGPRAG